MKPIHEEDKPMQDDVTEPTLQAERFNGPHSIICLECSRKSLSPDDIKHKFCSLCGYHVHMGHSHAIVDGVGTGDGLVSWEIRSNHPRYQGGWVVARMNKPIDGMVKPTDSFIAAASLEKMREILSKFCAFRFPRSVDSEIDLIETWV